jgi:CHAT domain-containing protein/Tfp pilus assembly protein PilF
VISEDVKAFRVDFDGALAGAAKKDPRWTSLFPEAAADYLNVTGDSLLLSDVAFANRASAAQRKKWYEATGWDETASTLQNSDPAKASNLFRRAAESYRGVGHLRREAVAWGSLGVACWNAGDFDCVADAYRRALTKRKALGDSLLIGRTLNGLGSLHFRQGEYDSALVYYEQARAVRERLGRPADLGTTLAYIGNVYYRLGNLKEARSLYMQALDRLGANGPRGPVSEARIGLANVLSDLGDNREAARIYREEIAAAEARGDTRWAAHIRGNLGLEVFRLGDHAEAIRELQAAEDTLAHFDDTYELSTLRNRTGIVYLDLSDYARALPAFEEAKKLAAASNNQTVLGNALVNLGGTYVEMGLLDKSQESLESALKQYEALKDTAGINEVNLKLALVYQKKGQYQEALELRRRVLKWNEEQGLLGPAANAHGSIAATLDLLGHSEEAQREYQTAADLAQRLGRNDILWPCFLGMGDSFERAGMLDSARVYNEKAINVLESLRGRSFSEETKAAFLGKWSYVYEAQIHVLAKLNALKPSPDLVEEAWTTAERGKARAFLDAMSVGDLRLELTLDAETVSRMKEQELIVNDLRHRLREATSAVPADSLAAWKKALQTAERRSAEIEERARLNNTRYAALTAEHPLSLGDMRRRLLSEDGALLLEYALGDSASYVFVLTSKESRLYSLPPRSEIEGQVRALRSVLSSPSSKGDAQFVQSATALYRMTLQPAKELLGRSKSVLIVPDGLLHLLPFDVLFESTRSPIPSEDKDRGAFFAKLPYAMGSRRVFYGPSASTMALMASQKKTEPRGRRLLAIGDPVFAGAGQDSGGLRSLPETRTEVESIAKRFRADERDVLLGAAAREKTLTEPDYLDKYRIIHFATHGLVDERHPERSSLALSYPQDPQEDGYLQASEIYHLHMNADLVVLSACETGLGRMVRGEGVLGLPRAFFYAGARSVLVSLWSVSDRSTAQLMTSFYGSLIGKGENTSRALSTAKETLRKNNNTAHPFYWAPFVLIGPPESENGRAEINRTH